ncbi:hypothetical protein GGS24DRAFT_492138 [Hypoxylon argillaceum]|nr:hypothetical protein GGS24DRAFT_492138 [Hypoxylon argillaceum]
MNQNNRHDYEAPEVAPQQSLPEVYYPAAIPVAPYRGENFASIPLKSFNPYPDTTAFAETPKSSYPGTNSILTYDNQSTRGALPPAEQPSEPSRRVCGYSVLVLILSGIIAVLLVAVIGLGAGAGILNTRVKNAEAKLAQPLADIDRGCSTDPDSVTATRYTSSFFDRSTYTIYCNDDAPNPPLQSLFVGNFDDCIDACASYSTYTRGNFPGMAMSANFTCSGVSFIPDWTNRTTAMAVNAPGNCYLKPGPQNSTALTHPSSDGPAVHAAILQTS